MDPRSPGVATVEQWNFNNIADKQKRTFCTSEKFLVLFNESVYYTFIIYILYSSNSEEETNICSWIFHTYQTCHLGIYLTLIMMIVSSEKALEESPGN